MRGNISSQYLSGLLMAMPCAEGPVELNIDGPLVSQPYVRMTLELMKSFGITLAASDKLDHFESPGNETYRAEVTPSSPTPPRRATFGRPPRLLAVRRRSTD